MEARKVSNVRATVPWRLTVFSILVLLAAAGIVFSIVSGAVHVSLSDIFHVFTGDIQGSVKAIIWNVRLPRTLIAALVGINLSLAGALLQGVMRNSMADPHIIGVSSGAGLFGIAALVIFPAYAYLMTPAAFVGALLTPALITYALAWQNGVSPGRIIFAPVELPVGIIMGAIGAPFAENISSSDMTVTR